MRLQRIRLWRLALPLAYCLLLSNFCKANYDLIKQQLDASIEQMKKDAESDDDVTDFTNRPSLLSGALDVFKSAKGDGKDKEFAEPMATSIEKLNGYGCWCYLREEYVRGRGKPKNEVDQLCKTMALGYDCAIIDGEQEGEDPCPEPWKIKYDAVIGGHHMSDIYGACGVLNPRNKCRQMACAIEGHFVSELMATMMALGGKIDVEYYHKPGKKHAIPGYTGKKDGWDPDEPGNCVWETGSNNNNNVSEQEEEEEDEEHTANHDHDENGGHGGGNGGNGHLDDDLDSISGTTQETPTTTTVPADVKRQCCGDWPLRHPYHTRNGQKACCGKRTYDNTFLSCCNEDHLRVVCQEDM